MVSALAGFGATVRGDLQTWRSASSLDLHSLWGDAGYVSDSIATPNLNDTNTWHVNGRGMPTPFVAQDINGVGRSVSVETGSTDIGAYEFTPSVPPRAATATGAPAAGTTTWFTVASDTVAAITWDASSAVPNDLEVRYYSGTNPPAAFSGANYMNSYLDITTSPTAGYDYSITLHYKPEALGTVPDESSLVIAKKDPASPWVPYSSTVTNTTFDKMTIDGLSNFSAFTGTDAITPLPVTLTRFDAVASGADAVLGWGTSAEKGTDRFVVERSIDGINFEVIAQPRAAGFSTGVLNYSYTDAAIAKVARGTVFYRLSHHDFDGNIEQHGVRMVRFTQTVEGSVSVFPNTFSNEIHVRLESGKGSVMQLELYDLRGSRVAVKQLQSAVESATFEGLDELPAGTYLLRIICTDRVHTAKVIRK
jgi:hypothetical protein